MTIRITTMALAILAPAALSAATIEEAATKLRPGPSIQESGGRPVQLAQNGNPRQRADVEAAEKLMRKEVQAIQRLQAPSSKIVKDIDERARKLNLVTPPPPPPPPPQPELYFD